jgi:hypothetical protein
LSDAVFGLNGEECGDGKAVIAGKPAPTLLGVMAVVFE